MSTFPSRRLFLTGSGAVLAASLAGSGLPGGGSPEAAAQERPALPPRGQFPMKVIASANGLEATRLAFQRLQAGADPLNAVVTGVELVEDDPNELTVGYGGLPNEDGVVELDAAVMHGPTHKGGAVAAVQGIRHVSRLAKLVLERTDHVLLVGEGAKRFARAHGFPEENLLTDRARRIWLHWKEAHSQHDDWLPPAAVDADVLEFFRTQMPSLSDRPTGTVHVSALNAQGDLACVTSTSGLAFKIPGRVGDSPILGAGLYVDNALGSCGSTGRGEANLQNLSSFAAVELMRAGKSPLEAGRELMRRIAEHTEPRLRDAQGRPNYNVKFYILAKDGRHAGVALYGPSQLAVTDAAGTRLEDCDCLYPRK